MRNFVIKVVEILICEYNNDTKSGCTIKFHPFYPAVFVGVTCLVLRFVGNADFIQFDQRRKSAKT